MQVPLLFILFPGADPVKEVEKFGAKLGFSQENRNFSLVAMGEAQEDIANGAIDEAVQNGGWVMLQVGALRSQQSLSPQRKRGQGQGCIRREGTAEAVRQAVGGGCRSGWGRLLSVTNAIEAGSWCQGDSGWA